MWCEIKKVLVLQEENYSVIIFGCLLLEVIRCLTVRIGWWSL
jgi:hypothetical protein